MDERRHPPLYCDPAFVLALIYTLGFFAVVIILLFVVIPSANDDVIKQIMPILSAIQLGIVQYFYNKANQQSSERAANTVEKVINTAAVIADTAKTAAGTAAVVAGVPQTIINGNNKDVPHG